MNALHLTAVAAEKPLLHRYVIFSNFVEARLRWSCKTQDSVGWGESAAEAYRDWELRGQHQARIRAQA